MEKQPLKIRPITEQNLADRVERRILEYLSEQGIKPGETLPTEKEFAEAIGVSRNVVREAFSRLRMMGYVKSKRRRGMVMEYPDVFGILSRVMEPAMMSEATQIDLIEFRMILEIGLAEVIFEKVTEEDLRELEKIIDEMTLDENGIESIEDNIRFHSYLFKISGNVILSNYQHILEWVFSYVDEYCKARGIPQRASAVTHRDILYELGHGTADIFRMTVIRHLDPHKQIVEEKKREMVASAEEDSSR